MPEGDTVHRVALTLGRELTGRVADAVEVQGIGGVAELGGRRVIGVEAVGKHMLVRFDGEWTLRVHLGMHGQWRRQHAREARRGRPTAVIVAGDVAYVCRRAYRAECIRSAHAARHPRLARLGPDLLASPPDVSGALARARLPAHAGREIADLLLDQRVAAGIGNVYKSEVLFLQRIPPRTRVSTLSDADLTGLFRCAARLLRANLHTRRRTTVPLQRRPRPASPRLWVYGRAGEPCIECGAPIERFLQGDMARSTYLCPRCQQPPDA